MRTKKIIGNGIGFIFTIGDCRTSANTNAYPYADAHSNADPYPDTNAHTHTYPNPDPDAHTSTDINNYNHARR